MDDVTTGFCEPLHQSKAANGTAYLSTKLSIDNPSSITPSLLLFALLFFAAQRWLRRMPTTCCISGTKFCCPLFCPKGQLFSNERPEALSLQLEYQRAREHTSCVKVRSGTSKETLLVDLKTIHRVCSDDAFPDRGLPKNERANPLSVHLFSLDNQRSRVVRDIMSRVLTPVKLKAMFPFHASSTQDLQNTIRASLNAEGYADINVKELMERFVTDDLGRTLFSVECDALRMPGNPFHAHCAQSFSGSWWRKLRQRLLRIWPSLAVRIPYRSKTAQFFQTVVSDLRTSRDDREKTQSDLLEAMFKAESSGCSKVMRSVQAAQMFASFRAGFEATAPTITFALLELAHHLDIQRRLQLELDSVLGQSSLTPDLLSDMKYLDCVVKETLRKYPPNAALIRRSSKRCYMSAFSDIPTTVTVDENERLVVPVYAVHHDPHFFSFPERFDPERFLSCGQERSNAATTHRKAYLPFGVGRRSCVARGYAIQQVKVGLVALCSTFDVELCAASLSVPPPFLGGRGIVLALRDDCLLRFWPRK